MGDADLSTSTDWKLGSWILVVVVIVIVFRIEVFK